ncbi:hypothetical protein FB451DRAFT_1487270 [Mycena latifolia]|nr:hypothetical protein FB451DRAFT_1487270 [Mycena latifolia]
MTTEAWQRGQLMACNPSTTFTNIFGVSRALWRIYEYSSLNLRVTGHRRGELIETIQYSGTYVTGSVTPPSLRSYCQNGLNSTKRLAVAWLTHLILPTSPTTSSSSSSKKFKCPLSSTTSASLAPRPRTVKLRTRTSGSDPHRRSRPPTSVPLACACPPRLDRPPAAARGLTCSTHRLRLIPHLNSWRSLRFEPIEHDFAEAPPTLRIGRSTGRATSCVRTLRLFLLPKGPIRRTYSLHMVSKRAAKTAASTSAIPIPKPNSTTILFLPSTSSARRRREGSHILSTATATHYSRASVQEIDVPDSPGHAPSELFQHHIAGVVDISPDAQEVIGRALWDPSSALPCPARLRGGDGGATPGLTESSICLKNVHTVVSVYSIKCSLTRE